MKDSALYFLAVLGSHLLVVLYIIIVPVSLEAIGGNLGSDELHFIAQPAVFLFRVSS